MSKQGKSVYQMSRVEANISRKSASEMLNISTESLGAYERGETRVPCDIVRSMAEVYADPMLAYSHILACPVGKRYLAAHGLAGAIVSYLFSRKQKPGIPRRSAKLA